MIWIYWRTKINQTSAAAIVEEDEISVDEEIYGNLQDPCTVAKVKTSYAEAHGFLEDGLALQ